MKHFSNQLAYLMMYAISVGCAVIGISVIIRSTDAMVFPYVIGAFFLFWSIFFIVIFGKEHRTYLKEYKLHLLLKEEHEQNSIEF